MFEKALDLIIDGSEGRRMKLYTKTILLLNQNKESKLCLSVIKAWDQ